MRNYKTFIVLFILIVGFIFWACSEKDPIGIEQFELAFPGSSPVINSSILTDGVDFSIGYYNGNIRTDRVKLEWAASTDEDFLCYKILKMEGEETERSFEGFEGGSIPANWNTYGDFGGWYVTDESPFQGNYCARTHEGSYGYEYLETTMNVQQDTEIFISFWANGYNDGQGRFRINGSTYDYWYPGGWCNYSFYYYTGYNTTVTLEWRYDTGYYGFGLLDNVEISGIGGDFSVVETFNDRNSTTLWDTTLTQNQYYTYKIASIIEQGTHKIDEITIKTPEWQAPDSIEVNGLSLTVIELVWKDNSESETAFTIYVDTLDVTIPAFVTIDSLTVNQDVTSKTFNDLDLSPLYRFGVKAINYFEEDTPVTYSADFSFNFDAPTNLNASQIPGLKSIELTWNDNATLESGFEIERKINSSEFELLATIPVYNTIEYTDYDTTSFEYGDTIAYRVRAYNDYDDIIYTDYSNEATVILSELTEIYVDFEDGQFPDDWSTWTSGGTGWYITNFAAYESVYSITCGGGYYDEEYLSTTINVPQYTYISISFYTREEDTSGDGDLYINGIHQFDWDNNSSSWGYESTTYYTGSNSEITLQWEYLTSGYGNTFIDNIQVTW
ncbi:MAG: hypothetical protein KAW88_02695 [Candidatus Cloacimonetes bacterium]|nr:hypothetical protein [Candidatus Cloacimonadota bacterium]